MGKESPEQLLISLQELFDGVREYYVLERDLADDTYLIVWRDFAGRTRKAWITDLAMRDLTETRTMH